MKKLLIGVLVLGGLFLLGDLIFIKKVPTNIYVAQTKVVFTKYSELEKTLNNIIEEKKINFEDEKLGKFSYSLKDLGITVKEHSEEIIKEKKHFIKWLNIMPQNMTNELLNIDEKSIEKSINNLMNEAGLKSPQNAYIYYENKNYHINKEVETNMIDASVVSKEISQNIKEDVYSLNTSNYYKIPTIKEEDLQSELEILNNLIIKEVTLEFGDQKYILSSDELSSFIDIKEDGSYTIKEEDFEEYVNNLAYTYDTIEYTKDKRTQNNFSATGLGKEFSQKMNDQNKDKFAIKVPNNPFVKNLTQKANTNEKTYIEVNLTSQYMWYYKEGKLFLDSPVVTGDHSNDWDTPTGKFKITEKKEDKTLNGSSVGFDYQYPVDYWMRITNSGVGFHDTKERSMSEYGSDTYLYGGGSHGCINLPPSNAKKLYENLEVGTVVYVTE